MSLLRKLCQQENLGENKEPSDSEKEDARPQETQEEKIQLVIWVEEHRIKRWFPKSLKMFDLLLETCDEYRLDAGQYEMLAYGLRNFEIYEIFFQNDTPIGSLAGINSIYIMKKASFISNEPVEEKIPVIPREYEESLMQIRERVSTLRTSDQSSRDFRSFQNLRMNDLKYEVLKNVVLLNYGPTSNDYSPDMFDDKRDDRFAKILLRCLLRDIQIRRAELLYDESESLGENYFQLCVDLIKDIALESTDPFPNDIDTILKLRYGPTFYQLLYCLSNHALYVRTFQNRTDRSGNNKLTCQLTSKDMRNIWYDHLLYLGFDPNSQGIAANKRMFDTKNILASRAVLYYLWHKSDPLESKVEAQYRLKAEESEKTVFEHGCVEWAFSVLHKNFDWGKIETLQVLCRAKGLSFYELLYCLIEYVRDKPIRKLERKNIQDPIKRYSTIVDEIKDATAFENMKDTWFLRTVQVGIYDEAVAIEEMDYCRDMFGTANGSGAAIILYLLFNRIDRERAINLQRYFPPTTAEMSGFFMKAVRDWVLDIPEFDCHPDVIGRTLDELHGEKFYAFLFFLTQFVIRDEVEEIAAEENAENILEEVVLEENILEENFLEENMEIDDIYTETTDSSDYADFDD